MLEDRDPVVDHLNGERYGGKVLSLIPAPEGWFVGTQVSQLKGGTETYEEPKVYPLLAWVLVDAMFREGDRKTQVEPLFLTEVEIVHATEFRWQQGAGDVDEDGQRTLVAVDVIPAPEAVADVPSYGKGNLKG
ncbi:hypothetical protein OG259_41165 [Streptomyces sp. NBC_00250]|uniref:hypothetical protein n=1 Tax=Streptomyces sp. NBC_00250 TaxID=2903641 RepID=UPI002E2D4DB7|nr:hypothetical protein [Streptomyces sp. NBC_00250]